MSPISMSGCEIVREVREVRDVALVLDSEKGPLPLEEMT